MHFSVALCHLALHAFFHGVRQQFIELGVCHSPQLCVGILDRDVVFLRAVYDFLDYIVLAVSFRFVFWFFCVLHACKK